MRVTIFNLYQASRQRGAFFISSPWYAIIYIGGYRLILSLFHHFL